jgi:hypothetical protein
MVALATMCACGGKGREGPVEMTHDATAGVGSSTGTTSYESTSETQATSTSVDSTDATTTGSEGSSSGGEHCNEENWGDLESMAEICAAVNPVDLEACHEAIGPDVPNNPCNWRCTYVEWFPVTRDGDVCEFGEGRRECFFEYPGSEGCNAPDTCADADGQVVVLLNDDGEVGRAYRGCDLRFTCDVLPQNPLCECACHPNYPGE